MQIDGTASTAPSLWPKPKKEPVSEKEEAAGEAADDGDEESDDEGDGQANFLYEQSTSGGLGAPRPRAQRFHARRRLPAVRGARHGWGCARLLGGCCGGGGSP